MDDTDRQLLALLRDNARSPIASLAKHLKVSRGTVQNRLLKLESSGIVAGYTVRTRPGVAPHRIRAWMGIGISGNRAPDVIRSLRGEPAIQTLHSTNGRWDVMAEVQADSLEAFDRALTRIREIEGIGNTETNILLSTHKV